MLATGRPRREVHPRTLGPLRTFPAPRDASSARYVNRMLDGVRTWFGLPAAAAKCLDADREALGMQRYEYLLHALYKRSQEIIERGPGFDGPNAMEKGKR